MLQSQEIMKEYYNTEYEQESTEIESISLGDIEKTKLYLANESKNIVAKEKRVFYLQKLLEKKRLDLKTQKR